MWAGIFFVIRMEGRWRLGIEDDLEVFGSVGGAKFGEPIGTVGKGRGGRDQRIDFDLTAGDKLEALRVFPGARTAAEHGDLTSHDLLQGEIDLGGEIADQHEAGAVAGDLDGEIDGGLNADDFEEDIGTAAAGEGANLLGGIDGGGVDDGGGAELSRHVQTSRLAVDGDHAFEASGAEGLNNEQADHAGPDDHGGIGGGDVASTYGVKRDGDGLSKGRLFVGERSGQTMNDARGDHDVFGEGTVLFVSVRGDAQDTAIIAQIDVAALARRALAAVDGRVEGDAFADGEIRDIGSDGGDFAGGFVAHDEGRLTATARTIPTVNVAATDATSSDANENLIGLSGRRLEFGEF